MCYEKSDYVRQVGIFILYKNISHFKSELMMTKIPIEKILVENSTYNHLKSRLYKEGLKERICEMCGTLDTHCGKNRNIKIKQDKLKKKNELKIEKRKDSMILKRTVERPTLETLKNDIETLGYLGTGRKYGV